MLDLRTHAVLDYVTVVAFVVSPALFGLEGLAATLAYVLAGVHLTMTLLTRFAGGVVDALPYDLHATVELAVGALLLVVPWLLGGTFDRGEQVFFSVAGAVILAVWALSGRRVIGAAGA